MEFVKQSLIPLIGGIVVLASIGGLGYLVRRVLGAKEVCPIAEAAGVGLCALVLVGGILNLAGAVSLTVILGVEGLGLVGLALDARALARRLRSWARDPAAIIVCGLLGLVYLRSVTNAWFAFGDDLNGYLEPVERLVQNGGLGRDPFLLQRLTGGDAYYFLEAVFVRQFGYYQISLLQPALGILMGVGAAVGWLRRDGVSRRLVVVTGLASCIALARVDYLATAVVLQAGLLVVLIVKCVSTRPRGLADAASIGLISGAAVALKIFAIPLVGIVILAWFASEALGQRRRRRDLARDGTAMVVAALVALGPWMMSSYLSSGTPLFPLLGVGYYGSAYGAVAYPGFGLDIPAVLATLFHFKRILLGVLLLPAAVGALYWRLDRREGADHMMLVLALSSVLIVLLIAVAMEASDFLRYAHSTYGSVAVAAFAWASCRVSQARISWPSLRAPAAVTVIAVVALLQSPHPWFFLSRSYANLAQLVTGDADLSLRLENARVVATNYRGVPLVDAGERAALERAQAATERDKRILVSLQRAYLLDFKRNEIWSAGDYAGSASPPPGFPLNGTGQEVEAYLANVGVHYVMFQYAGPEPWFDDAKLIVATSAFDDVPWNDSAIHAVLRFREALERLMSVATAIYRDDRFVVIKVGTP